MKWFRFYSEALHDPKVQTLPPWLFKFWVNLLCVAAEQDDRGSVPGVDELVWATKGRRVDVERALSGLRDRGLLDGESPSLRVHNWGRRQYKSDDVTRRVKRFRNDQWNVSETPPDNRVQITDSVPTERAAPPPLAVAIEHFYAATKVNEQVGALVDCARAAGVDLSGGEAAHLVKAHGHGEGELYALQERARIRPAGKPIEFMKGVIRGRQNGRRDAGSRPGTVTAEDLERARTR